MVRLSTDLHQFPPIFCVGARRALPYPLRSLCGSVCIPSAEQRSAPTAQKVRRGGEIVEYNLTLPPWFGGVLP